MAPSLTSNEVEALLRAAGPGSVMHLVGAGGCGMSGLGHLLLDLGHRVTGSDLVVNEEVRQLQARGAQIHCGHHAANVRTTGPALVVHTSAASLDNIELETARELGLPVARRAVMLAALLHRQRGICVAGMHGKTTTTALLAFVLEQLGLHPSYAVGAMAPQLPRPARYTDSPRGPAPWFVIEADESDGTLTQFWPEHAILLNVDAEHLDHFPDLTAVHREFGCFTSQTKGLRLFCKDDSNLCQLLEGQPRTVSFGFHSQADYRVERRSSGEAGAGGPEQLFTVWHQGATLGDFRTSLLGEKNVSNVVAVIALLHQLGFPAGDIARAIALFRGATRRQQLLFSDGQIQVYDDYGHHPNEVQATLRALKEVHPGRLLVAFQPHRYTRTLHLMREFATAFHEADALWLSEIYAASEPPIPGVSGQVLAEAIRAQGQPVEYVPRWQDLGAAVLAALQAGDLVLFLGAGDTSKVAHEVAAELQRRSPLSPLTNRVHGLVDPAALVLA